MKQIIKFFFLRNKKKGLLYKDAANFIWIEVNVRYGKGIKKININIFLYNYSVSADSFDFIYFDNVHNSFLKRILHNFEDFEAVITLTKKYF